MLFSHVFILCLWTSSVSLWGLWYDPPVLSHQSSSLNHQAIKLDLRHLRFSFRSLTSMTICLLVFKNFKSLDPHHLNNSQHSTPVNITSKSRVESRI